MMAQRIGIILTLVNLVLLFGILGYVRPAAASGGELPVLRGSGLEIVDKSGRVRADLSIFPETVMFRMADANGKPHVKMGTMQKGAYLGLLGEKEPADVLLSASGDDILMRLTPAAGRKREIRP